MIIIVLMDIFQSISMPSNIRVNNLTKRSQGLRMCWTYYESIGHLLKIGKILYVRVLNCRKIVLRICEYCAHNTKRNIHNSLYCESSGGKHI